MPTTLSDSQFTDEFNKCLFVYEYEKCFLCAVDLGSYLEQIMVIIVIGVKREIGYLKVFPKIQLFKIM